MATQLVALTLPDRVKVLTFDVAFFFVVFVAVSGRWLPTGGLESVWLFAAIALWFLSLLSAPWFVPPRDALANAVAGSCLLVAADLSAVNVLQVPLQTIGRVAVGYCTVVALLALISLLSTPHGDRSPNGHAAFRLTVNFGRAELLYTPAAVISFVGAYQSRPAAMASLFLIWIFFITARPAERFLLAFRQWQSDRKAGPDSNDVGVIERIDHPDIVRVTLFKGANWKPDALYTAAMSDGDQRFVLALFSQVQGEEVVGTGLCVASVGDPIPASRGHVYATHDGEKASGFIENLSGTKGSKLIGFTVERSTIGVLRFEVSTAAELSEGDVAFAGVSGRDVFYQILDAETSEESFDQNPRGMHIVRAAQLGCYDRVRGFTKYPWLPSMNTPLFWAKDRSFEAPQLGPEDVVIGMVPSTEIPVVANIDSLIEYHTAILGVTGTGKTELALDIVREAAQRGAKVFCVDFTGEYMARLDDLKPLSPSPSSKEVTDLEAKLFDAETGDYGAGKEKKALNASLKTMRAGIKKQVEAFLVGGADKVAILELAEIANSKATLRLTELYLSSIMDWARQNCKARQIMIVLEEAHTIIPETNGAGFDFDTQWVVSRIGQIALQGRKYGVGLLVVSQRTALVSKTICLSATHF